MEHKRFPLFIDLTGRRAVVVGGGKVGLRRAAALCRFGAAVTVISPGLAEGPEGAACVPRAYRPGDLAGTFLAVAATDDPAVNAAVGREARDRGIFFNRADDPADCDFFFPALCEGGGLVAGVTGSGDHKKTAWAARAIRVILEKDETSYEAAHREQGQQAGGDPVGAGHGGAPEGPSGAGAGAGDREDHRG